MTGRRTVHVLQLPDELFECIAGLGYSGLLTLSGVCKELRTRIFPRLCAARSVYMDFKERAAAIVVGSACKVKSPYSIFVLQPFVERVHNRLLLDPGHLITPPAVELLRASHGLTIGAEIQLLVQFANEFGIRN